jgi:ubiquinone/menaquinone biosynthesis C-methylase UbiE
MQKSLKRSALFALGVFLGAPVGIRIAMRLTPRITPARFGVWLDSPLRRMYRDPAGTLDFVSIHRNATVLDGGCGTGTFTLEAARRAGPGGIVHAVDIQQPMLDAVARKLGEQPATQTRPASTTPANVQLSLAPLHHLPLPGNTVDVALLISVLPMVGSPNRALREIRRVLKPGGTLVIGEEFVEPDYVRPATVRRWAEQAGFMLVGRSGNPFSYLLKFIKPISPIEVLTAENEIDA